MSQIGEGRAMPLRQKLLGAIVATGLVFSLSACGGDDEPTGSTPISTTPSPTVTPTPTPVDPTVAAKAKVIADYKNYIAFRGRGFVSNNPTYPYDQVMTGNALQADKSIASGNQMIGRKYSGSVTFLKATVTALNLKTKPATATVQGCITDALVLKDKQGKVLTDPPSNLSTSDKLIFVSNRWKITETSSEGASGPGCSR
jgi:hypothetical protein